MLQPTHLHPHGSMYVWLVNSTLIKHSDYFVWKDTSERVTLRCNNTVDKERVNPCVLNISFWRELSNQKTFPKTPEIRSPEHYYFEVLKISQLTPQKRTCSTRFLETALPAILIKSNQLMWGQRFWKLIFFIEPGRMALTPHLPNSIKHVTICDQVDRRNLPRSPHPAPHPLLRAHPLSRLFSLDTLLRFSILARSISRRRGPPSNKNEPTLKNTTHWKDWEWPGLQGVFFFPPFLPGFFSWIWDAIISFIFGSAIIWDSIFFGFVSW